jgi:hypothetical protein
VIHVVGTSVLSYTGHNRRHKAMKHEVSYLIGEFSFTSADNLQSVMHTSQRVMRTLSLAYTFRRNDRGMIRMNELM